MTANAPGQLEGDEFVISRIFNAPLDLVWKAHTDCAHLKHWWGPKGFTTTVCRIDLRPGGIFHYCLRSPDGIEMWGKFLFREVVLRERLVCIVAFSDEMGGLTRHPMNPSWPREILSTVTFAEKNGKTTLTVRWAPYNATAEERATFIAGQDSMTQGWTGTLDQLEAHLAKV
jgi:uncharacterized protein YndB with AHSA1/START domain